MKRGIILRTAGLVFQAILLLILVLLLLRLSGVITASPEPQVNQDFERYLTELKDLNQLDAVPVQTLGGNYTLKFFSPSSRKPAKCGSSACMCIFVGDVGEHNDNQVDCQKIKDIADKCTTKLSCFDPETIILYKKPPLHPETIYFCKDTSNHISVKKEEC